MTRRKLDSTLVLQIFQLRVQKKTIDQILEAMGDDIVSRGTVAKYVRAYEDIPEHLKLRDLPFEWRRLERAGLPWEASEWVMECQFTLEKNIYLEWVHSVEESGKLADKPLANWLVYTNRWAEWCWRVHLADPNLKVMQVLEMAHWYAHAEQVAEVLPDGAQIDMSWLDAVLRFRPYAGSVEKTVYMDAAKHGMISTLDDCSAGQDDAERLLEQLPTSAEEQIDNTIAMRLGLLLWLKERIETTEETESQSELVNPQEVK